MQNEDTEGPEAILLYLKEKCSQYIYERLEVLSTANQKRKPKQKERLKLKELNFEHCSLDNNTVIAIAKLLPHLTQLEELNLSRNEIEDTGAIAIANAVSKLKQLKTLDLHCNLFGDSGATAIANAVSNLTQLQALYLHNLLIGDSGATAIGNSLTNLTQLHCTLYQNHITPSVAQQLKQQFGDKWAVEVPVYDDYDYH